MTEVIKGIGVVAGTAVGKIKVLSQDMSTAIEHYAAGTPEQETEKFLAARLQATQQIERIIASLGGSSDNNQAAIMEAHIFMLNDASLEEKVLQKIAVSMPAPQAVLEAAAEFADLLAGVDDSYLRERAADVLDIGRRITRLLLEIEPAEWGSEPVILYARDIDPSILADIPAEIIRGLILGHGSTTSHAVIVAKAKGIITIVGVKDSDRLIENTLVALDGANGEIIIAPDSGKLGEILSKLQTEQEQYATDLANSILPAVTTDGRKVQLAANIGSPHDLEHALKFGCEGVGLFRSEFLFMGRSSPPTEEEQFNAYREAAEKCGNHVCVIRTLDIGGDKPLSYLTVEQESNPFLGWRAIRISLDLPELFITQLKAILRAGLYGKIAIMLPMVISISEIRQARDLLAQAKNLLASEGKEFNPELPLGIMVETPAAAVSAAQLAKECDFFSLGTNDLTQYTLAVDRGNQKVMKLYDYFHPSVLSLIENVIRAAHAQGIWAGVCGEMASDPLAAVLLVGMGIDELSMSATALPRVREQIRRISTVKAQEVLNQVRSFDDAAATRGYLVKYLA